MIFRKLSILSIILCAIAVSAAAQSSNAQFGQNRVQYKEYIWSFYETENFNIYYYQGGQDLGKFVILAAEDQLNQITKKLDINLRIPVDVMVYHDVSDLNQTNIGIYREPENIGGTTKILGNKVFLYFNGDHNDLLRQLREGITRIYIEKLLTGSSFQEVIQNAVLLNLPNWFTEGLISYMGEGWTSDKENRLKYGILSGSYKKFKSVEEKELIFIGHSLWHYIELTYGDAAIANLLYLTRINRSVEHGFMFVLGKTVNEAFNDWYKYYYKRFKEERELFEQPAEDDIVDMRYRKNLDYYQLKVSPDGRYVAFATNIMGLKKVIIYDLEKDRKNRVLKYGFKTKTIVTDNQYPLIEWEPGGKKLSVIYGFRDKIKLMQYDATTNKKEKREIRKFQEIFDFSYGENKNFLLISGMQKGQCDLFRYYLPSTRNEKITNDIWDDLDPTYVEVNGRKGYVFASNRKDDTLAFRQLDTTLPVGTYDLFFYEIGTTDGLLSRITNTPGINETEPHHLSNDHLVYLSDINGIRNRYAAKLEPNFVYNRIVYYYTDLDYGRKDSIAIREDIPIDSVVEPGSIKINRTRIEPVYKLVGKSFPLSEYSANIIEQDITNTSVAVSLYKDELEGTMFFTEQLDTSFTNKKNELEKSSFGNEMNKVKRSGPEIIQPEPTEEGKEEETPKVEEKKPEKENVYYFQSPFDHLYIDGDTTDGLESYNFDEIFTEETDKVESVENYQFTKTKTYRLRFMTEEIITQVDNRILMTRYQKFDPNNPVFNNPNFGGLFEVGITDLFENHKLRGGFKIPTSFDETEFYVSYENLKKRVDKKILYYRKSAEETTTSDNIPFNTQPVPGYLQNRPFFYQLKTNYIEASFKYAISIPQSIRWTFAFRNDQYVYKATDQFTLNLPNFNDNWTFTRVDYVFDNTIDIGVNLKNGMRFNVFFEFHKNIPAREDTLFGRFEVPLPQFNDAYFTVSGFDFRHYQKIHRNIVWANRIAAGTSWGTRKLVYYLGGIENWLVPEFDRTTDVNLDNDYAFQTVATNLRGFKQNVRNGNNYFVINSELRFPIFSYLIRSPIKSEFIRNFHIVGFADVGTAWEFGSPFKEKPFIVARFPEREPGVPGTSTVNVEVEKLKNPIVAGFGGGIRATLFGYFIRTDVAWGWDSGIISSPVWYLSLGMDF